MKPGIERLFQHELCHIRLGDRDLYASLATRCQNLPFPGWRLVRCQAHGPDKHVIEIRRRNAVFHRMQILLRLAQYRAEHAPPEDFDETKRREVIMDAE